MADARKMLKGLLGFSIVPITTALITIFVIPVISNVFPAEEYGKINLFYSVGALLTTLFMLGLDNSFIRYYFEPPRGLSRQSIQTMALAVGLVVTILCAAVCILFFSDPVSSYLFGEYRPWLIAMLAAYVAASVLFRLLNIDARMSERHGRYCVQSIAQTLITRIAFVAIALVSTRYVYSVVAMTVGMLVLALLFAFVQRRSFGRFESRVPHESVVILLSFGVPVMLTNFVLNLNGTAGRLILSGAGMYDAAGVFAIATTLSNVFTVIPTAFSTWWSPFMYKNYKTERETITKVHDLVMLGAGIIVALIIMLQNVLFSLVGGEYAACQTYFMIIMLNPIQALICETTSYGIAIKEHPIYNAVASAIGVATSIVVTIVLMKDFGVYAAALGVAASAIVTGIIRSVIGQRYYRCVASPLRTVVGSALIAIACFANSVFCQSVGVEIVAGAAMLVIFGLMYAREARGALAAVRKHGQNGR